ncbi:hypothetical protein DQ04_05911030 [Trypanosoma grayi]|uniref:hypothetical protein n=1 Tax=Trypanosoma grayi TaxID=71804 RepID=UPI0004F47559|nr:hypothetical protein DQ04_05911030 [Trypanosoma grayi]KEG09053.1 hypothetical protein DQ04_05911030 [Trypanosoma grayi]
MTREPEFDVSQLELRLGELQTIWEGVRDNSSAASASHRYSLPTRPTTSPRKKKSQSQQLSATPGFLQSSSGASTRVRRRHTMEPTGPGVGEPGSRPTLVGVGRAGQRSPSSRSPSRVYSKSPVSAAVQPARDFSPRNTSTGGLLPPLEVSASRQAPRSCQSCGFAGVRPTALFCQNCGKRF